MSRIDPNNVVVLVRDSSDAIVRIGVSSWEQLRRFQEIETQVGKAMTG